MPLQKLSLLRLLLPGRGAVAVIPMLMDSIWLKSTLKNNNPVHVILDAKAAMPQELPPEIQ